MMIVAKHKMRKIQIGALVVVGILSGGMMAHAAGPWRAGEGNTRGWELMTPKERIEHQARVRGFTDYKACRVYRTQHHHLMVERAEQRGLDLPDSQRDFCDRLKPRTSPPDLD